MDPKRVVIRKYENRRLYDSSRSRYVNLEEIARLIRDGVDVQVVDAKTGEDLTRTTLTQIIVENTKEGPAGLPLELLRQLIVASDHVGKEFIMWYLKSAFEAYERVQGAFSSGLSDVGAVAASPVESLKNFLRNGSPAGSREATDVAELRSRLAELESLMQKPSRRSTRGPEPVKRVARKTRKKKS